MLNRESGKIFVSICDRISRDHYKSKGNTITGETYIKDFYDILSL